MGLYFVQLACFYAILLYTSINDIKTQTVPPITYLLLFITGMMNPPFTAIIGLSLTFLPLLIIGLIVPDCIGGGDIKFGSLCGMVLTGAGGLTALLIGALLCLLAAPVISKIQNSKLNELTIPFIPFLSVGCFFATLI